MAVISSYLLLFISFYFATYRKEGKAPSGRKTARRMSQAPLPDPHDILAAATHGAVANGSATNGSAKATGAKTNGTARSRKA